MSAFRFGKLLSGEAEANLRDALRERVAAMDAQLREQPREVRSCRRCVMSNQRPRIAFDAEGICSACRFAERKRASIDWDAREHELAALLDRHRGMTWPGLVSSPYAQLHAFTLLIRHEPESPRASDRHAVCLMSSTWLPASL